jgi:hypothetical protein
MIKLCGDRHDDTLTPLFKNVVWMAGLILLIISPSSRRLYIGLVWQRKGNSHSPFSLIPKITNFKTFQLYITSIIFFYYLNKKIHYNTNFFYFFIQNSFYFISHLSILTLTTNSPSLTKQAHIELWDRLFERTLMYYVNFTV